jgi:hypothetical protein
MLSVRLIKLIEAHAESLTREVVEDLPTNENTPAFRRISKAELEPRVFAFYQNLGNWIGDPKEDAVRAEYEEWGRIRTRQGIPVSEIVYSLILTKRHLRRYIREHAFIIFSGDRVTPDEMIPYKLYSMQELNHVVGDFFDNVLYCLTRGVEIQAKAKHSAASP